MTKAAGESCARQLRYTRLDSRDERTTAIETLFANSLTVALRRNRITSHFREEVLADLAQIDIRTDPETNQHAWSSTLQLADRYRLTLYDAAYLELAQRRQLPLASSIRR